MKHHYNTKYRNVLIRRCIRHSFSFINCDQTIYQEEHEAIKRSSQLEYDFLRCFVCGFLQDCLNWAFPLPRRCLCHFLSYVLATTGVLTLSSLKISCPSRWTTWNDILPSVRPSHRWPDGLLRKSCFTDKSPGKISWLRWCWWQGSQRTRSIPTTYLTTFCLCLLPWASRHRALEGLLCWRHGPWQKVLQCCSVEKPWCRHIYVRQASFCWQGLFSPGNCCEPFLSTLDIISCAWECFIWNASSYFK